MDPVGFTARMTAAARARETERPDRLFTDAFAAEPAGREGFEFLDRHDAAVGQRRPVFAVRTRFFDAHLLAAAQDLGIRQGILLTAGLDTRAFRLEWPAGVHIYELDKPEVLAYKATVLASFEAAPRCSRHVAAVDLRTEWPGVLLAAGYRTEEPSIWLAEGLLFYLPAAAVGRLLDDVASLSVAGSRLGTDLMDAHLLEFARGPALCAVVCAAWDPVPVLDGRPVRIPSGAWVGGSDRRCRRGSRAPGPNHARPVFARGSARCHRHCPATLIGHWA